MPGAPFSAKLQLVLKALSLSRGRLAADLGVDKSLVGRWASGAVTPSEHNLQRLTERVARAKPGFSMLEWDRDLPDLAAQLGVQPPTAQAPPASPPQTTLPPGFGAWMPPGVAEEVVATTRKHAWIYEGFWRTTRVVAEAPGRFWHDYTMVRQSTPGMLMQRIGIAGHPFDGWLVPLRNQLFGMATHPGSGMIVFCILNGVSRVKAEVLDGLTLAPIADAGGSPVAAPIIMERLGDLAGDRDADDARFAELLKSPTLAAEDEVPLDVRQHLYRDFGPSALAQGGDGVLKLFYGASLSRGAILAPPMVPSPPAEGGGATVIRPAFGRATAS
jgi:transcriptional regulator with XRE-family HTH domain